MAYIRKFLPLLILTIFTIVIYLFAILTLKSIKFDIFVFSFLLIIMGLSAGFWINSAKSYFLILNFKINTIFTTDVLLSLGITVFLFLTRTHTFFDDSGFTLRYLDNFSNGYFYSYNPSDGPVFGISCFLNLIFCFGISLTGLFNPNEILHLSNIIGLFFTSFLTLKILHKISSQKSVVYISWLLLILCSKHFLLVVFSGMETPFHLAIILASMYFSIIEKPKLMWLFLTLSVISKLDAAPIALVIGFIYLFTHWQRLKKFSLTKSVYSEIIIYCIIPLLIWITFIYLIFGSLLPQSAYAKVFHYPHPNNSWFPFLDTYLNDRFLKPALILFVLLFVLQFISWLGDRSKDTIYRLLPGLISFASLFLYYLYNPSEKMLWYYAIPSFMILFQLVVSINWLISKLSPERSKYFFPIILFAIIIFLSNDVKSSSSWMKKYLYTVENERIRIGEYLDKISNKENILLARHGLISRPFKGYVIDNSGLNSRLATNYKMNSDSLIKEFHPDYVINHAWPDFMSILNNNNYRLTQVFPDISLNDFPLWVLYEPNTDSNQYVLKYLDKSYFENIRIGQTKMISKLKFENCILTLPESPDELKSRLIICVEKKLKNFNLDIEFIKNDSTFSNKEIVITKTDNQNEISRFVQTVAIDIKDQSIEKIRFYNTEHSEIIIYSPFIEYLKK